MSIQNGDVVILQIGGVQVGAIVSNSTGMTADMLEKNSKDIPGIKEYDGGETGWTMSVESLYDPSATEGLSEALGYLKAGTEITVVHGINGTHESQGSGFIQSVDCSGPKNEIGSYSLEIQGTAEYSIDLGPELMSNYNFATWTGDDPDDYSIANEDASNYVTEHANGAQFIYNDAAPQNLSINQLGIMTIGLKYRYTIVISGYNSGIIAASDAGVGAGGQQMSSNGTHIFDFTSVAGDPRIGRLTGANIDLVIESFSVKRWL